MGHTGSIQWAIVSTRFSWMFRYNSESSPPARNAMGWPSAFRERPGRRFFRQSRSGPVFNRCLDAASIYHVVRGIVLDQLNDWLRLHGVWFSIDVSTATQCILGGMGGSFGYGPDHHDISMRMARAVESSMWRAYLIGRWIKNRNWNFLGETVEMKTKLTLTAENVHPILDAAAHTPLSELRRRESRLYES